MVEKICQRAKCVLSSEIKTGRVTADESGDSEDREEDEIPCVIGGESKEDCISGEFIIS